MQKPNELTIECCLLHYVKCVHALAFISRITPRGQFDKSDLQTLLACRMQTVAASRFTHAEVRGRRYTLFWL